MTHLPEYAPNGLLMAAHESGRLFVVAANEVGGSERVIHGEFTPDGQRVPTGRPFDHDGRTLIWTFEVIRDVTADGTTYTWDAHVCVPVEHQSTGAWWTPAYIAQSEARRRTSDATARHARRVRLEQATVERFDPHDIYERDGWICALCTEPVDPDVAWPDLMCASLDHIIPLVANGEHSMGNTQLAHWICNVRKGVSVYGSGGSA